MKQFLKNFRALRLVKSGRNRTASVEELESKHQEAAIAHYSDLLYFAGLTDDGISFVTRMSFRNKKLNENWLKVHIPGEGVWGFENRGMIEGAGFQQGKLEYRCGEAGKIWRILFRGQLFQGEKYYQITLDLVWTSTLPLVDFVKDGFSVEQNAFQIASRQWGSGFVKRLKTLRRKHYEQAGEIKGTITWKRIRHRVAMKAIRTHSFGRHNWKEWERHFWFTGLLDDGRMLHTGIVDFNFVRNLRSGFVADGEKTITLLKTPLFGDLKFSEESTKALSFEVRRKDGEEKKTVALEMGEAFLFTMDETYSIRQAKAIFTYDGMKGIGIVEMGLKLKKFKAGKE